MDLNFQVEVMRVLNLVNASVRVLGFFWLSAAELLTMLNHQPCDCEQRFVRPTCELPGDGRHRLQLHGAQVAHGGAEPPSAL